MPGKQEYVLEFSEITMDDVARVGGKNASLGEMFRALKPKGVNVLDGFATTADAFRRFLQEQDLGRRLHDILAGLDLEDVAHLAEVGHACRSAVLEVPFPEDLRTAFLTAYRSLIDRVGREPELAVRSSATAEDLPDASFAGQQETYLNVRGEQELLDAVHNCFASLFTDRAISYRQRHGFDHELWRSRPE